MPSTTTLKNAKNTAATAQAKLERAASRIGSRSVASRSLALGVRRSESQPSARFQLTCDHHPSKGKAHSAKSENAITSGPDPCRRRSPGAIAIRYTNTKTAPARFAAVQIAPSRQSSRFRSTQVLLLTSEAYDQRKRSSLCHRSHPTPILNRSVRRGRWVDH